MKTAVITGGNSGIGKATAASLAEKGYRIIIHGKNEAKTIQAVEEIKERSGNKNVDYIVSDVSLLKGMKELAEAIKQKTESVHALVLSTGVILPSYILTADGLEMGFSIQYLSRFAVTHLLMPELSRGMAKIVHVGAPVIRNAKIFFEDIALKNHFTMVKAMAQEMFANHLFVQEFAKRNPETRVLMNMAHVGMAKTGITRNMNFLFRAAVAIAGKSPESAAKNFIFLATDESVNYSGYFLKSPRRSDRKEKIQHDPVTAEKLWNKSMELINEIL